MTNGINSTEDSFTIVTSRRKKNKNKRTSSIKPELNIESVDDCDYDEDLILQRIKETKTDLNVSDYFIAFVTKFEKLLSNRKQIDEIICFGIGHFIDCAISRHQLAFILAVQCKFTIKRIVFHEPILNRVEVNILKKLNCEICVENIEGKYHLDSTKSTLVYSPHCPKQLTNNLLWCNWTVDQLVSLIFIGNSFSNLISSTPTRFLERDVEFITAIEAFTEEIAIENSFKFTDIFNDTSIHTFARETLEKIDREIWKKRSEQSPSYAEDIELITAGIIEKLNL